MNNVYNVYAKPFGRRHAIGIGQVAADNKPQALAAATAKYGVAGNRPGKPDGSEPAVYADDVVEVDPS